MVIEPGSPSHNKGGLSSATSSQKAKAAAPSAPVVVAKVAPGSVDNVSLSARAQSLAKLESRINQAPDVDRGKVEAIKQAIAEGRYKVDPQKIAAVMLAEEESAT